MAKNLRSRAKPELSIRITIQECLTHYSFGPRARSGVGTVDGFLMLTVHGPIVSPDEKAGHVLQVMITESDHHVKALDGPAGQRGPTIGELHWGRSRAATLYVPVGSLWNISHGISTGALKEITLAVDTPLRGSVPVRSLHMLTREYQIENLRSGGAEQ